ncbi:MAG: hypothetical protein AB7P08_06615 [Burkholderiales bacterium]
MSVRLSNAHREWIERYRAERLERLEELFNEPDAMLPRAMKGTLPFDPPTQPLPPAGTAETEG